MEKSRLLPCPFCGGKSSAHQYGNQLTVGCMKCFISTLLYWPEEAIEKWNTRAESQQLTDLQESLKASQEENQRLKYDKVYIETTLGDILAETRDRLKTAEELSSRLSNELEGCRAEKSKT